MGGVYALIMSQVLQGKVANLTSGSGSPDHFWNGIPIAADGGLAIENAAVIDHFSQGLPMTALGRLVVALDGIVDHFGSGAAPFDSAGRLVVSVANNTAVSYLAGVPYNSSNAVILGGAI